MTVEEIPVPLVDDAYFQRFDDLLHRHRYTLLLHATVVGRFFAGEKIHNPKGTYWGGYGHFGCCSLLVIQQVLSVEPLTQVRHETG
jgi:hypothetical protein